MKEILESVESNQSALARVQIEAMGFSNFASYLEGWLNNDLITQEQFNKLAVIGLYAAGKKLD